MSPQTAASFLDRREAVKIFYMAFNNEASKYLKELFYRLSDIPNRELHYSKTDLHVPLLKTSSGQNSFVYREVCIWNNLTISSFMYNNLQLILDKDFNRFLT